MTVNLSFIVYQYVYNYTCTMKTFSETLKTLRKSRSLRQEDLAHELNLSRSQINNYENGFLSLISLHYFASLPISM